MNQSIDNCSSNIIILMISMPKRLCYIYQVPPPWGTLVDVIQIIHIFMFILSALVKPNSNKSHQNNFWKKRLTWPQQCSTEQPSTVPRPGKKKEEGKKIKEPAVERSLWVAAWMLADIWSLTIKVGWDSWTRRKRSGGRKDKTRRSGAAVVWGLIPWRHTLRFLREIRAIGWRREKGNDLWRRHTWKRCVNTLIVKNERVQTRRECRV